MKIAYVIESLHNTGGIERVITQKANWLANNTEHEITILTFRQLPSQDDFFKPDNKVNRVRLIGKNLDRNDNLLQKLNQWLAENPQDVCISSYGQEFKILPKLKDPSKKIVEFHFCYDINTKWTQKSYHPVLAKMIGFARTKKMRYVANKYDKIVVLTKRDLEKWKSPKVEVIQNPVTIVPPESSDCSVKRVIALGRMDRQKGFDFLIDAWKRIEKKYPDWKLDIFGSADPTPYQKMIEENQLKRIKINPPTDNVPKELINSSIYVMSSRYEGFPLSICEAMSCGLPIVTFDCPNGPAELVEDGKNGFVVAKVGDVEQLADRISRLIENEELRREFGKKSLELSRQYQIDIIMKSWEKLFHSLSAK